MGLKDKTSRCSERLITRHLTLRLGYTPAPEVVRAQRNRLNSGYSRQLSPKPLVSQQNTIFTDINLARAESSELLDRANHHAPKLITMADEQRIGGIEDDVSGLKTDVGELKNDVANINGKMDNLLQAMDRLGMNQQTPETRQAGSTQQQPAPINSTATQTAPNHHNQGQQSVTNPMHRPNSARNRQYDEFIQTEMDRDRFTYPDTGKMHPSVDILGRVFSKPYMYVYRDGLSTMKQKLEARQSITASEYIDATLSLLSDPRAFHPDDYPDIFDHLRKVSRDALERPWHAVRRWTQYIWDEVESGAMVWADRDMIQEERVRMCLTSVYNTPNNSQISAYQIPARRQQGLQEVTCRQFNTRNGCAHRESHVEGQVYALHICTYCDSLGRTCFHSVRECERRLNHTRNDGYNGRNRNYNQGNNQHLSHTNHHQSNYMASKNGF